MKKVCAVVGAAGYAGGELCRVLVDHPTVSIKHLMGNSSVGRKMKEFHPHIPQLADHVVEATDIKVLSSCDIVFFALPHGKSGELTRQLRDINTDTVVIDCAADHRLSDPAEWERYYHSPAHEPWTYGLPELVLGGSGTDAAAAPRQRSNLANATEIAVPGCNVTAVTLAAQPALFHSLVDPSSIVATLAVGYSGAGKALKPHLMASVALGNAQPYSVGGTHRHIPEILQNLRTAAPGQDVAVTMTPVLVPITRGILATVTAPLTDEAARLSDEELTQLWKDFYANEPIIDICASGTPAQLAAVIGAPGAQISVCADRRSGQLVMLGAIDNLTKGTATQAVQSMNCALGLDELTGLTLGGLAP